ncbi:MAG: sugar phosphate isomerase/epimerase [Tannerellaceae bacterium]|nr:sugar phosphate isomerase/epimerase [Tannerellaceae bacterium]
MQNRRDFLKRASLMLAGGAVLPQLLTSCGGGSTSGAAATTSATTKNIGLQLYSLRDMVKEDGIQKTLEVVSKMGYKNLEAASYDNGKIYGLAPAEFKKIVNDLGMKCTSSHLGQAFSKDKEAEVMSWWDQAIDAHNELGVKYMVQPFMPVNDQTTLDDLKMYCDYFNTVGYKTAAASIQFGYHNHDFEFRKIDGITIYDYLLDNVSPNHVFFQMDVYWVTMGGGDPVGYLKERPTKLKPWGFYPEQLAAE